jgi:transketolase
MPDMTVLAPADEVECAAAMRWATDHQGPVYLRLARDVCPDVFDSHYQFTPGKTYLLKEGGEVLLVSTGPQSARCKEAAQLLESQGISAGVLHVPSIKPLNVEELVRACEPFRLVVTVEEHNVHGGLGALVAEILSEHSPRRVIRIGIKDRWGESAPNEYLLDLFQLSPARLSEGIKQVVRRTK